MSAKIIFLAFIVVLFVAMVSCQSEEQLEFARYYSSGSLTYQDKCQNCHGKNGGGLGGLIPPLTDTSYLKAHIKTLACMVKYGLNDTISINHKTFAEKMAPIELTPVEIAGVLTYVTNSFGNKKGTISVEEVEKSLTNCR